MLLLDNLCIIIPAKDEAENLPSLLHAIQKIITCTIIVVDNNSKDQTSSIARQYTKYVVKEPKAGYGNACLCGIKYANGLKPKPKLICFFDGDGQCLVSDIEKVVKPLIQKNSLQYCQGSRMQLNTAKTSLKGSAFVANKVFSLILSKIWKQQITDLGPLRCISLDLLNKLKMKSKTYAWTIEMNTKLLKMHEPILEVPAHYQIRKHGKSKISGNFKTALRASGIMSIMFIKTAVFWRTTFD